MCLHNCETSAENMERHNNNMRAAAGQRLGALAKMKTHRWPEAAFNRKSAAKLTMRLAGYNTTINDPANRGKDMSGYHKPGSMQKVY